MRIGKTVNGVSTGQIWNNGNVIAEYGTKGTKMYIRGAGGEIEKTKDSASNSRYFSYNAHGDTTNIIEKNAESTSFAITAAYEYDAFGGLVSGTGGEADSNGFRYNGQYTDEETGLIYFRNRYYDPSIGRFTQEDPIQSGTNWYVYCENDPINFIDILGLLREANPRRDQTENVEGTFVTKITAEKIKIENKKLIEAGNACNWNSDDLELQKVTQETNERIAQLIKEDNAAVVYNVPIWPQGENDCWLCVKMMVYMNNNNITIINDDNRNELNSYYSSVAKSLSDKTNTNGSIKTNKSEPWSDEQCKKYLIDNIGNGPIKVNFAGSRIEDMSHDMLVVGVMVIDGDMYVKYNNSYNQTTSDWVPYDEFKEINNQTFVRAYQ